MPYLIGIWIETSVQTDQKPRSEWLKDVQVMLTKIFLTSIQQYEGAYFSIYFTHMAPDNTEFSMWTLRRN